MGRPAVTLYLIESREHRREGFRLMLGLDDTLTILGEASTTHEAWLAIPNLAPDVILTDIQDFDAFREFLARLNTERPKSRVIVIKDEVDPDEMAILTRAEVKGFATSDVTVESLLSGVRCVASGGLWFSPELSSVAQRVISGELSLIELGGPVGVSAGKPVFTDREREILLKVLQGLSNQQIAERLHLSVETVKTYVRRIMDKSSLRSRRELVAYYVQHDFQAHSVID